MIRSSLSSIMGISPVGYQLSSGPHGRCTAPPGPAHDDLLQVFGNLAGHGQQHVHVLAQILGQSTEAGLRGCATSLRSSLLR